MFVIFRLMILAVVLMLIVGGIIGLVFLIKWAAKSKNPPAPPQYPYPPQQYPYAQQPPTPSSDQYPPQ